MKVKIIKKDFSFSLPYFDLGKYQYKINNYRFVENRYISLEKCGDEPFIISEELLEIIMILKDKSPIRNDENTVLPNNFPHIYLYKNTLFGIDKHNGYTHNENKLMIKEHYYKHNEEIRKLRKKIELFESLDTASMNPSREPIPEKIRFSVWRRDEGKCVQCGSNNGLEFDHIIPFSKGGSNTERNLQLLCEKCNREKSAKI